MQQKNQMQKLNSNHPTLKMDEHKFVIWLPQDKKREVNMQDLIWIKHTLGTWEPETTELVKNILKEGQTAIDIGTSVGYFSLLFARQVGSTGKVLSVEQGPMQFNYMDYNVKNNGYEDRSIRYNNAAYNQNIEYQLPILGYQKMDWKVQGIKVDDLVKKHNLKVDFIKMDIDGGEPEALEGLQETFENNPNLQMVIEYYPSYIEGAGGSTQKFWDILDKYFTYEKLGADHDVASEKLALHYNLICKRKPI